MTDRDKVDITFAIDFSAVTTGMDFGHVLTQVYERDSGFEKLADHIKVTTSIALQFPDAAVKSLAMQKAQPANITTANGLDYFEMEDVDDRTSAYLMSGTLSSCLDASAAALQGLGKGGEQITLFDDFERAQKGQAIKPEIAAFYQWMDARVNGNLKPPTNS